MKISNIEKYLKLVVQNISNNIPLGCEEKENIDIYLDLPLKKKEDLDSLETKLSNNASYQNVMVSLISLYFNFIKFCTNKMCNSF